MSTQPLRRVDPATVTARERYHLLTSLIVPRPIGWVSTRSRAGVPNLGAFSYFAALSPSPMLVGVSIGSRAGLPKDSLVNIRETGAFCVNVVGEAQLESMNLTSGEYPPEIDEFDLAGLPLAEAETVDAPLIANAPAVFECRLFKEVELEGAGHTLIIGEVTGVRLSAELEFEPGTMRVDPESWRPVGRMGGNGYVVVGEGGGRVELERPR